MTRMALDQPTQPTSARYVVPCNNLVQALRDLYVARIPRTRYGQSDIEPPSIRYDIDLTTS
jgi:hypothetical protein